MRKLTLGLLIFCGLLVSACNVLPATVVVVVTSTPDPKVIQVTVTPSTQVAAANLSTLAVTTNPTTAPTVVTVAPTVIPATAIPTATLAATETRAQLYIAQEDFEHGYMFWISTRKAIWVLYISPSNPNRDGGEWESYDDSWVDGEAEIDPSIVAPGGNLIQPKRGFGKLWRTPGMRDALGWATTPEFNLTTNYIYHPSGTVNADNVYVPVQALMKSLH